MIRVFIALAAIGLMSLSAFAQPVSQGSPEQNETTRKATAQRVIKGETKCTGCDLFQVDLSYQDLPNRDFSGSRLRQSDLSLATFDRATFAGANLSIVNAFGARFEDANFAGANLQEATLVGAWFGGANLSSANLSNANLSGAYLVTAKGLTQGQLERACGDASTELPKGFRLPACKAKGIELAQAVTEAASVAPAVETPVVETPAPVEQPKPEVKAVDPTPPVLAMPRTQTVPAPLAASQFDAIDGAPELAGAPRTR